VKPPLLPVLLPRPPLLVLPLPAPLLLPETGVLAEPEHANPEHIPATSKQAVATLVGTRNVLWRISIRSSSVRHHRGSPSSGSGGKACDGIDVRGAYPSPLHRQRE
jgi:hypothetical protein